MSVFLIYRIPILSTKDNIEPTLILLKYMKHFSCYSQALDNIYSLYEDCCIVWNLLAKTLMYVNYWTGYI